MIEGPSLGCVGGMVWVIMYLEPAEWYWTEDVPFS
jgi:hypothetical protein